MSEEASKITFDVITNILFGEDINSKMELVPYYDPKTGMTTPLNAHDSITKISEAQALQATKPINSVFPFLVDFNIGADN